MTKYVCSVCGWVYDGEEPFEDLPDDYTCPMCSAPKSAFNEVCE
ncbi:MAG: rubredoxin [Coriobacteriia bacterium]|nr:rubredoxin [Coriobacteriia bacterium]